jgi:UDP-glucuronate decarboxylase
VGHVNSYGPRACYDEGKRAAEALFYDYRRIHNVDTRIVRIFNTYGPNMCVADGRVVSNFIVQALRNEDITIYGDGSQSRSFCYVSDLIDAMLTVYNSDVQTPVNIGNPGEFTMLELAKKVIQITNSKSKIIFMPLPEDDPKQRRPDIGLVNSLGWSPKIPLDNGLYVTVDYFKEKLSH